MYFGLSDMLQMCVSRHLEVVWGYGCEMSVLVFVNCCVVNILAAMICSGRAGGGRFVWGYDIKAKWRKM